MKKAMKRMISIGICILMLLPVLIGCTSLSDYDSGLLKQGSKWYYAEDGKIVEDKEGLVDIDGNLFYFEDGALSDKTTFCEYKKKEYYVEKGLVRKDRSGQVTVGGEEFYVLKGVLTQCHEDGHDFVGGDCQTPPVCQVCTWTDESVVSHDWWGGSCTEAAYCYVCGAVGEAPTGHDFENGYCTRCGEAEEEKVTAEKVSLKIWAPVEDQLEGGWLLEMEERFEAAHPEYDITWINDICSEGDAGHLVTADPWAAGDVYMFANDQLDALVNAGAITMLGGQYLEQVKNDNSQTLINTVTHTDGNIYGFPMTNNTWFMYYNKDVYSEEDVKSLNTMLEKGVVAFPMTLGWYTGAFFFANGGKVFGDYGHDAHAGIQFGPDNGGYEAALAMVQIAAHPNFRNDESGLGNDGLKTGDVGAYFSGSWDYALLKEALGDKLGAVQLPTLEIGGTQKQLKAFAGSKAVGINPYSVYPEVAAKFASFLASEEGQKLRYEMRGVIPAAKVLAEDDSVKQNAVAVAEINTMTNCAVVQPSIPEMSNFWTPVGNFGTLVVCGEVTAENYKDQVDLLMEGLNWAGW